MSAEPPFSHPVRVASLSRTGVTVALRPSAAEREAIAAFLGIPSIEAFEAIVSVAPARGRSFHATGALKADVHQLCVVSLEPFHTAIEEAIDARFAPADTLEPPPRREVERTLSDEDPPEPLEGGAIDIGMLAVEALALGLDPYPRAPGVRLPESASDGAAQSPFAALAALKKPSPG